MPAAAIQYTGGCGECP